MTVEPRTSHGASPQLALDWTLDPLEARVLTLLRVRRGRALAIRVPELAALASREPRAASRDRRVSPREIQEIVRRLREQHGCPILSSAGRSAAGGPGYWWAATAEELEQCIREQRRKAISTLVVLRALRRHRARLAGQMPLASREPRAESADAAPGAAVHGSTLSLEPRTSNAEHGAVA